MNLILKQTSFVNEPNKGENFIDAERPWSWMKSVKQERKLREDTEIIIKEEFKEKHKFKIKKEEVDNNSIINI